MHNILTYQVILDVKGNQMFWKDRKILHKEYRYFQDAYKYGLLIQVTLIQYRMTTSVTILCSCH